MFRNRSVNVHQFAMIPRADIPRSSFDIESMHKTTFDSGYLIPVYVNEVLPGDTFKLKMTAFARMATPIFPVMDNMYLDSFFFFVPNRLVWENWEKFMGAQEDPTSSISFILPFLSSQNGGFPVCSIYDYFGLPTVGQVTAGLNVAICALPLRAYNLIWNEWFRDENLQDSVDVEVDDGPDSNTQYALLRRGKRRDYFTSALPFPQKGTSVPLPLGVSAPVYGFGIATAQANAASGADTIQTGGVVAAAGTRGWPSAQYFMLDALNSAGNSGAGGHQPNIYADLTAATAATINQLRQSFQIQKFLERGARGGTRYTEIVQSRFGVMSPDARLSRPEYLGGGSTPININPIGQTSGTSASGTTTPLGTLSGVATVLAHNHGFTQSFTEHGWIIGLVSVRADLTYQQGLRKMWKRSTLYDLYSPEFQALGEQAILNREIYCKGDTDPNDALVFGYQERWAEYRYMPSMITGLFRSTSAGTLDPWHLAQNFTALPTLNTTFIQDTPPVSRVVAVTSANKQFIFDSFFQNRVARPMPMYSVPGMIDHF